MLPLILIMFIISMLTFIGYCLSHSLIVAPDVQPARQAVTSTLVVRARGSHRDGPPGQGKIPGYAWGGVTVLCLLNSNIATHDIHVHVEGDLVEWLRPSSASPNDTDGFEVRRVGETPVQCRVLLQLDQQPERFKLSPALSDLLGVRAETRQQIIVLLWQYIKVCHVFVCHYMHALSLTHSLP